MIDDAQYYNVVPVPTTPAFDPITAGIQTATMVAQTIGQINDADKRRNYEFAISRLSADRQQLLNNQMLRAKTLTDRLGILANAVAMVKAEETRSRIQSSESAERNKMILIIGGGMALLITAFLIKKV
jgi:hypothetical protein